MTVFHNLLARCLGEATDKFEESTQMLSQVYRIRYPSIDGEMGKAIITMREAAEELITQVTSHIREDRFEDSVVSCLGPPCDAIRRKLYCLNSLSLALFHQGKYAQAEANFRNQWDVSAKTVGSDHPWTLEEIRDLTYMIRHQDDVSEEAETLLRDLVHTEKKAFGVKHKQTQSDFCRLIDHLHHMGNLEEARDTAHRL